MIDISSEQLLTLAEAAAMLPGRPNISTLWRWRSRGVRGRRLETIQIGQRIYTSVEALQRFSLPSGGDSAQQPLRSPAARQRAIERAERELSEAGI